MKLLCIMITFAFAAHAQTHTEQFTTLSLADLAPCLEGKGFADTLKPFDRLPASAQATVPEKVWGLSRHSAGMAYRFTTDASSLQIAWTVGGKLDLGHMPSTGVSGIDIYQRIDGAWRLLKNGRPYQHTNTVEVAITPKAETLVYLPLYNSTETFSIQLPQDKTLAPVAAQKAKRPIVIYGTSITQGACASRPGIAYTAIMGRIADHPVINLGFAGSARMEKELADLLAQIPASIYVLDPLWNMGNIKPDDITARARTFLNILKDKHPETPILLTGKCDRFDKVDAGSKNFDALCKQLKAEDSKKWSNLHYLPPNGMLGSDGESTVDCIHPNDLGMVIQGKLFGETVRTILSQ